VAVAERNGTGVTYGWAVVFWDDLLDLAYPNDMGSARKLERAAHLCETQQVGPPDRQVGHLGGYVPALAVPGWLRSSPSGRRHWGVDLRHEHEAGDPSAIEADLVVRPRCPQRGTTTSFGRLPPEYPGRSPKRPGASATPGRKTSHQLSRCEPGQDESCPFLRHRI
jgi:hypothetical protein